METTERVTPEQVAADINGAVEQMTPEQLEGFNRVVDTGVQNQEAGEQALASYMDGLPAHVRDQLQRGLVGADQLTPEQLRDLARISSIDGDVAGLAYAGRGDRSSNPGDWQQVVAGGMQGQELSDGETVAPPAGLPDMKGPGKDGHEL